MRCARGCAALAALVAAAAATPGCEDSSQDSPGLADAGAGDARPPAPPAIIRTIAGRNSASSGFADGDALVDARFDTPEGLALDPSGRHLYIADTANHAIRRLDLTTMTVTTVAGVGTMPGSADTPAPGGKSLLRTPRNLVFAPDGSLYFTDTGNYVVRRLDVTSGMVTTVLGKSGAAGSADGRGQEARFGAAGIGNPWGGGLAIDVTTTPASPVMYLADTANSTVRAVDLVTRDVRTLAGRAGVLGFADGPAASAVFNKPAGLALVGGKLYVTEANNIDVRAIDLAARIVTTVAGKAPRDPYQFCEFISSVQPPECGWMDSPRGTDARFRFPFGVALDTSAGFYIVDSHNSVIRRFDTVTSAVTTAAGVQMEILDDIPHESEETTADREGTFWHPTHAVFTPPNILYVADRAANCIRRVELGRR